MCNGTDHVVDFGDGRYGTRDAGWIADYIRWAIA